MSLPLPSWLNPQLVADLRWRLGDGLAAGEARRLCHASLISGLLSTQTPKVNDPVGWLESAPTAHPVDRSMLSFGPAWVNGRHDPLLSACDTVRAAASDFDPSSAPSLSLVLLLGNRYGQTLNQIAELLDESPEWVSAVAGDAVGELAANQKVRVAVGGALAVVGATAAGLEVDDDTPRARRIRDDSVSSTAGTGGATGLLMLCGLLMVPLLIVAVILFANREGDAQNDPTEAGERTPVTEQVPQPGLRDQPPSPIPSPSNEDSEKLPALAPGSDADADNDTPQQPPGGPETADGTDAAPSPHPEGLLPGELVWGRLFPPETVEFPTFYEDLALWGDPRLVVREGRNPEDKSLTLIYCVLPGQPTREVGPRRGFQKGKIFEYHASLEREHLVEISYRIMDRTIGRYMYRADPNSVWRYTDWGVRPEAHPYFNTTLDHINARTALLDQRVKAWKSFEGGPREDPTPQQRRERAAAAAAAKQREEEGQKSEEKGG